MTEADPRSESGVGARALGVIGIMLYLVIGAVPYFGTPLVVPFPWVFVLWAVWIAGLAVTIRVYRQWPAWTLLAPVTAVAFWVLFVQVGSWLFGWTA
jgi:hypothetical protein